MYFIDGHCDTLTTAINKGESLLDHTGHLNLRKLASFRTAVQIFAVWLNEEQLATPYDTAIQIIEQGSQAFTNNAELIRPARSYTQVLENINAGVCSAILGLEGAEPIGTDMARLHKLHEKGMRVLTLTWNRDNALSGGITTPNAPGLTNFGVDVVAECQSLGVIVDVSHISEKGFWDVAQITTKPFFASHSNCKALASHRRNLDNKQIRAIAGSGGVVGVNFCDAFLSDGYAPDMEDVLRHLEHIINTGGVESAALGGDLDGIPEPASKWFEDVQIYESIFYRLAQIYGNTVAEKVFFKNYLRLFKDTLG